VKGEAILRLVALGRPKWPLATGVRPL